MIRQDGSHLNHLMISFSWQIDNDGSKSIDVIELLEFYGHAGLDKSSLHNLLMLCGYDDGAIHDIYGRAGLLSASVSSVATSYRSFDHQGEIPNVEGGIKSSYALSKVPDKVRRAQMLRQRQRAHFLQRMAEDDDEGKGVGGHITAETSYESSAGAKGRLRGPRGADQSSSAPEDSDKWSISDSMTSSDGITLRNSIFERSLAWLDSELQSQTSGATSTTSRGHSRGQVAISASVGIRASAHFTPSPPSDREGGGSLVASPRVQREARGRRRRGEGPSNVRSANSNAVVASDTTRSRDRGHRERGVMLVSAGGDYTVFPGPSEASLLGGSGRNGRINDWEFRPPQR